MKTGSFHFTPFLFVALCFYLMPNYNYAQSYLIPKEKKGKWGFVTWKKDKKVIDFKYEAVNYFRNGLSSVKQDGKWGFINIKGKTVIPFQYDDAGDFDTQNTYVRNGEKYGLINQNGEMITDWTYDTLFYTSQYFTGKKNGLYGTIDTLGQDAIPFIYDNYNSVHRGNFLFKKEGKWGTVTVDGKEDFVSEPVFLVPDVMPKFPGCPKMADEKEWKDCAVKKMLYFIYGQIKYPAEARKYGVEGTVVISFIVKKDGQIEEAKIVREIGAGCGDECLRIVKAMPQWTPGQHEGNIVNTRFNLPVKFRLE